MLLDRISSQTGLSDGYLLNLAMSAGHQYKIYQIPKRQGGTRTIAHPSRRVKFLQRWLVQNLIGNLPVHSAATAYQPGASIKQNAEAHVSNNFLLKLDFKDFFPSITANDVIAHLVRSAGHLSFELSPQDRILVARIVTRQGAIPIGAPSSPVFSNQIMYEFDLRLHNICNSIGVSFTRYADDLFFSTNEPNLLSGVHRSVQSLLNEIAFPRLRLNAPKTVYTSRRRRRVVTGIILTSDRKLSLGRKQKRYVRSLIYRLQSNQLPPEKVDYLSGYLAYAQSVEPSYLDSLRAKFGVALLDAVMGKS